MLRHFLRKCRVAQATHQVKKSWVLRMQAINVEMTMCYRALEFISCEDHLRFIRPQGQHL